MAQGKKLYLRVEVSTGKNKRASASAQTSFRKNLEKVPL